MSRAPFVVRVAAAALAAVAALLTTACGRTADRGPITILVLPEAGIAAAQELQRVVERLSSQTQTPTEQEFRDAISVWRTEPEHELDASFGRAITRTAADGTEFAMRPVVGDRFPVRVLYLDDGSFVAAAAHDEHDGPSNLLFRCRLRASEVLAAASVTSMQFAANLSPELTVAVRLYVGGGFTMPSRAAVATTELLAQCLGHLSDRRSARFGDDQQTEVQGVHDFFFEVSPDR